MLYEELTIPRSCAYQILELFKDKRLDGSKVKLCYFDCLPNKQFMAELPIIFPNLTNSIAHHAYSTTPWSFYHKINQTSHVKDEPYKSISHSIPLMYIPKCQFKNLKRLILFEFNKPFSSIANQLDHLGKFTSLKSLILHKFNMTMHALETIHANCTELEHLEIFPTHIVMDGFRFDHLIEPADYLKSLRIVGSSGCLFLDGFFLEYVIQKYPNLKILKYSSKHGISHENMNRFTNISFSSILPKVMAKLLDQIQSFHIDSCLFEYIMNGVDLPPTNIRDLGFYLWDHCHSKLFETMKVFSFIQSLNSLTSLALPISQALKLYNDRIVLPNLKHLFLGDKFVKKHGCLTLKLDKLLHIYQSLESLEINHSRSTISLDCISNSKYLSLCNMELNVGRIEPQITTFIKDSLPNVNRFKLITHGIQEEIIFDFPEHTFYTFDVMIFTFALSGRIKKIYYHVSTQGGTKMIDFIYGATDNFGRVKEMNIKQWNQKYLPNSSLFKIACKNLFELKCNGIIIF